ncbi:MAG: polymer-forming cytoskeletal protein [Candidatus Omnitrophica bacterium]|nr:polymer-forming cytoskeletal protein [Candidatus Omnitrophota bacterium]
MDILRNERSGQAVSTPQANIQQASSPKNENPYTTLGKDTDFEGTLQFKEGLKIEGRFKGDITSEGYLIIGKTGEVTAEINVGSIIVEGKVTGNIIADELVELRASAQMRGDITASKMKIEEGVLFVGKSDVQPQNVRKDVGSKPAPQQPAKQEEKKDKAAAPNSGK